LANVNPYVSDGAVLSNFEQELVSGFFFCFVFVLFGFVNFLQAKTKTQHSEHVQ